MSASRVSSNKPNARPIPWNSLLWALPLGYVFYDPFQQRSHWTEWAVTCVALTTVLALFMIGVTFWDSKKVARGVCGALFAVAIGFMAYRPSGGIFFPMTAVFVPLAVGLNLPWLSAILIVGILGVFGVEWGLLYMGRPGIGNVFPLLAAAEILLVGPGMAFHLRQMHATKRLDKTEERERIARDLHDVLGHTLSSVALKAELARRLFHIEPERALTEIADVERISREALDEVREAIHGYHAGDIQSEFDRVESMLKAADITVDRRCDDIQIDPAHERVLALILREAATNVVRHAQAKVCRLALVRSIDAYRLEVCDDGCGTQYHEGIGMRSIRTRIEALGGSASWSSNLGTQLLITLPITASTEQP